jgi:hypothetical protein
MSIDHEQTVAVRRRDQEATAGVTLWDEALERMMDCPSERALGRPLLDAVN